MDETLGWTNVWRDNIVNAPSETPTINILGVKERRADLGLVLVNAFRR